MNNRNNVYSFQENFTFNISTKSVVFANSPARLIPTPQLTDFSLNDFINFVITSERQIVADFFTPQNWNRNSIIVTMSDNPAEHIKGSSCSVYLQQLGKSIEDECIGTLLNINAFIPGGYLYRDLKVFVDGLANIRVITHDLNNQFQVITGFGSALEDEMTDPDLKECATNVMNAVGKAIDHNQDLRKMFPPKNLPRLYSINSDSSENPEQIQPATAHENKGETPVESVVKSESVSSGATPVATESIGVLVIDDEPLVQRFLCEMLKRLKYTATGCTTAHQAIQTLKENPGLYTLAIVDMNLPDLSSELLFDQLKEIKPDIRVVLISGDNIGETSQRILDKGANGYLQKPTTIKTLAETISKIIHES